MPAFQPYWGKLAVRNDRGDRGNVGIIRSPVRASILPDRSTHVRRPSPTGAARIGNSGGSRRQPTLVSFHRPDADATGRARSDAQATDCARPPVAPAGVAGRGRNGVPAPLHVPAEGRRRGWAIIGWMVRPRARQRSQNLAGGADSRPCDRPYAGHRARAVQGGNQRHHIG